MGRVLWFAEKTKGITAKKLLRKEGRGKRTKKEDEDEEEEKGKNAKENAIQFNKIKLKIDIGESRRLNNLQWFLAYVQNAFSKS